VGREDHRRTGEQVGEEQEADLERVAAEDVSHRELVPETDRCQAARDLGQRRGRRQERRPKTVPCIPIRWAR
jgi:hypothetical protein